jgi:dTDP-4-dehydrorhamnose reductase
LSLRILQFGRSGQVARELIDWAAVAGMALTALGRDQVDLARPAQIEAAIAAHDIDLVINAAAYTAVDRAESEEALATAVNGTAPGVMANACAARGVSLVHLSTDYVFGGGQARPWTEDDAPAPATAYGRSKLAGEAAIAASGARALVLRTSWVFSAHGSNFVKTMLRLAAAGGPLRVVDDQTGRPTCAADIAEFILAAAPRMAAGDAAATGLFHFAGEGAVTWRRFAEAIVDAAGLDVPVAPIATADYPTPAKRPINSVLDTARLERVFGVRPRPWRAGLDETIVRLKAAEDRA